MINVWENPACLIVDVNLVKNNIKPQFINKFFKNSFSIEFDSITLVF